MPKKKTIQDKPVKVVKPKKSELEILIDEREELFARMRAGEDISSKKFLEIKKRIYILENMNVR